MINKIKNAIKEGTFFLKVKNKINVVFKKIIRHMYEPFIKIDNNKILFLTFQGNYNCNPKAIVEEILKGNKNYKLYWMIRPENKKNYNQYPKELHLVVRGSFKFYIAAASAKIIIDNANNYEYLHLKKKKGQYLLQTWHGSMGFKKLDAASLKNSTWDNWKRKAIEAGKITDYCISNSDFETEVFKTSYWPNTPVLHYGHARNDILFNLNEEKTKLNIKIRKLYHVDEDTKIALYAPTFRDTLDFESYNLDYSKLVRSLEKRFGGKWCVFVRFHFKLKNAKIPEKYLKKVINVTDYYDMQELLCVCDLGITDYSSWMCDFVLTKKPGFLFTLDLEKYTDERGFYYPLNSTPFGVADSNEKLEEKILNFDEKTYLHKIDKFLNERGCIEDGHASERIVKKIDELISEK